MTEPTVTWVKRLPAPALRPFIEAHIGYRMTGFVSGAHRGLPSRHLTLIVSIGPAIDVVAQTDPTQIAAAVPLRRRRPAGLPGPDRP